jgi:hypothetical protein
MIMAKHKFTRLIKIGLDVRNLDVYYIVGHIWSQNLYLISNFWHHMTNKQKAIFSMQSLEKKLNRTTYGSFLL